MQFYPGAVPLCLPSLITKFEGVPLIGGLKWGGSVSDFTMLSRKWCEIELR